MSAVVNVGVLALQGDVREHKAMVETLGMPALEVRLPAQLDKVDALILPGGESTAMSKLLASSGLFDAITCRLQDESLALFGTCAGMILCATDILDGTSDQRSFDAFSATVRRNGIGRQVQSHETVVDVKGLDQTFPAVFIRPPVVEKVSGEVDVLAATDDGKPVLCAQGKHLFATFHPELTGDLRIHQLFFERL